MKKTKSVTAAFLGLIFCTNVASAAVLFSEDFDSQNDWSPAQGALGASCIPGQNCAAPIPSGFYDYRVAGTAACSNLDGRHNTLNINGLHPRGAGKSFMMWNEPCYSKSGSWGSDGLLGIDFAPQDEVYVRYWIQFQPDWRWDGDGSVDGRPLGGAKTSPMQKFLHISHLNHANTNFWDFFSGTQNKPRFTPQLAKFGGGSYRIQFNLPHSPLTAARDSSASFSSNVYLGAAPADMAVPGPGGLPAAPRDGRWHCFEFYVKLNSAGGVADGVSKVWYDGALVASNSSVVWVPAGDDPALWKWNHAWLGGNNANVYLPANEQWYAVDDVVVSTTYSGPPARPVNVAASAGAAGTVNLSWAAGSNGAPHSATGYRIRYGEDPADLNMKADVGNVLKYSITNLDPSTKYHFAVSAYSKAGYDDNENEGVPSVTVNATTAAALPPVTPPADSVAPFAAISSPAGGSTVKGTVTVNVAAADNVAVSKVELYLNDAIYGVIGSASNAPASNISDNTIALYSAPWNTAVYADGTYKLTAKAYDAAGNVGQASASVSVKNAPADTAAPSVTTFSIPASAAVLTVPVVFTASDNFGVTGYLITASATPPTASSTGWRSPAPTSYTFPARGKYTLYAWAKDAAGNVSAPRTASITVVSPPVVDIITPTAGSYVGAAATIGTTAASSVGISSLRIYVDGVLKSKTSTNSLSWRWNTTNYGSGGHTIKVIAVDSLDNSVTKSITVYK